MKKYLKKVENTFYWWLDKLNKEKYIQLYPKYLRSLGININERPGDCWISPTIFLDSAGYDYISIGDNCTISFDVVILVHDYSINNALRMLDVPIDEKHKMIIRKVSIGDNCFIGARAIILPGTTIGNDCIIGSGSVVRGTIPNGSVVSGNPAMVISKTGEFALKHLEKNDFIFDIR